MFKILKLLKLKLWHGAWCIGHGANLDLSKPIALCLKISQRLIAQIFHSYMLDVIFSKDFEQLVLQCAESFEVSGAKVSRKLTFEANNYSFQSERIIINPDKSLTK